MRIVTSALACVFIVGTVCNAAPSSGVRFVRRFLPARSIVRPGMRPPMRAFGRYAVPSCSGATHGGYAFDSNTEFMTNLSDTEIFAESNLAAGEASGAFEGAGNVVCDASAVIAGGSSNLIDHATQRTATNSFIGAGQSNTIMEDYSFIGAGSSNEVIAQDAFIGSGIYNSISSTGSAIGGGGTLANKAPGNQIGGSDSFIGSGDQNNVGADDAFLGGGANNTVGASATYGSLIGGRLNTVSGTYGTVIGGYKNAANGAYAIVAGGNSDTATGTLTFAAGYHAVAAHNGSFVWSDYVANSNPVQDAAANQFVVRASGGTTVYSNEAATAGVKLAAGSGTWASLSDRNAKTDLAPLDDASVLAKVDALPVGTWRYKSERGVRHAGPMAQDFYAAFRVGEDDRHITPIDEDGVALAAIKALSHQIAGLRGEIGNLHGEVAGLHGEVGALRGENAALKTRVTALARPR